MSLTWRDEVVENPTTAEDQLVRTFVQIDPNTGEAVGGSAGGGGLGVWASASFTPAAGAYGANDVFSVAQQLAFVNRAGDAFAGGELMITSAVFEVHHTALIASEGAYDFHLYNVTPPSARADNAVWDLPSGDRAAYIARFPLGTPVDIGSTLRIATDGINKQITVPTGGICFAELVTVPAFTPTAVVRKVTLHGVPL